MNTPNVLRARPVVDFWHVLAQLVYEVGGKKLIQSIESCLKKRLELMSVDKANIPSIADKDISIII